jgi:hypothetical protein
MSGPRFPPAPGFAALVLTAVLSTPFAIAAAVRESSPAGAFLVLGVGAVAAFVLGGGKPWRRIPRHGLLSVGVVLALLGPPIALAARLDPAEASRRASRLPVAAVAIPSGRGSTGYVLHARPGRFLNGAELVRVRRSRIGGWTAGASIRLPNGCGFPERIGGTEEPDVLPSAPSERHTGVRIARNDVERVCRVASEPVVVGIAPPGTVHIEAETIGGEEVDVPIGAGGAFAIILEEDTIAAYFVRLAFHDAHGTLLDSKPTGSGEYANFAYASGLIRRTDDTENTAQLPVTVSRYILSPREFRRLCRSEPPYGDGYVAIAIVRRDDGQTREVVFGNGMPLSVIHRRPEPPIVRDSRGLPCFLL